MFSVLDIIQGMIRIIQNIQTHKIRQLKHGISYKL
jgi:hypothetical protein